MKPNKKRLAIILSSIGLVIVILIGIGGKIYMDNQAEQREKQAELRKNLEKSKEEIVELLMWNYKDVQSVTF
ncbi:hypothetical protein OfM1_14730 [Lactovum odontotermitis]